MLSPAKMPDTACCIQALKYAAVCLVTDSIAVLLALIAGVFLMATIDELCDGGV